MHLLSIKALIAVISASVLAIGVAMAPAVGGAHPHDSGRARQTASLEEDGLQFLGQLAVENVMPDAALKRSWTDDVTAVAHSLGLTNRVLARQFSAGRSLAQIAASRGVPTSTATTVLLRHVHDDLDRAEHDQALSPTAARALVDALSTALGNP
jgi:hypothetical protein